MTSPTRRLIINYTDAALLFTVGLASHTRARAGITLGIPGASTVARRLGRAPRRLRRGTQIAAGPDQHSARISDRPSPAWPVQDNTRSQREHL
jgi:hypothetical protein